MTDQYNFPHSLFEEYLIRRDAIQTRLQDFKNVPESAYFYELCYCICTPQSKARNAFKVQRILEEKDFLKTPENIVKSLEIVYSFFKKTCAHVSS